MKVLVIGGTGRVGGHVASALAMRGIHVRVMSRSPQKIAELRPPLSGVVADLNRPETLKDAFAGIDRLFLVTAHTITETGQGIAAVHAAVSAGLQRIVYMSAAAPPGATRIPHVASKAPIEHAIIGSRLDYTILRPTELFQNDLAHAGAIAFGLYPVPIGDLGISRIDGRDVADAAVNALTRSGHEGRIYTLGGSDVLTGDSVAEAYGLRLERRVDYAGNALDLWEQTVGASLPRWQRNDYQIMYRYLQEHGLRLTPRELVDQLRVVGHAPRPFDDFVEATCRAWMAWNAVGCGER
ncbi:MAG: hypothetical protein JWO56_1278 [Acidobacteria bacterium]|nr:hypothetical protein [Acidobacteriota bacterium]